ncbi:antitoxin Xre-like helix-turn-helix domain-containing protein [Elstera cyanobacteriorum]|uniref:type II RES/Xre toxin-antitoxin system antitoxin n=1 Tax=Elstera cyanobacteriorum TaxID=2022747 RepID=UPI002356B218|nr:antitoxin Xre-like helix-turn-helix domain-containing protein [Elstera cyanobacteriorum]MCK6444310.1 DUF2384 domain-containing protein [Elstera cyanobacteriorum]
MAGVARQQTDRLALSTGGSFVRLYRASPSERIAAIKAGVPAQAAKRFIADLHLGQTVVFDALNLKTATVNKKAAQGKPLSVEESERVLGLARLVGQLEAMLEETGAGEGFDARAWLAQWLSAPLPALGGGRPIELLDTMEGQGLVARMLAQVQSGAYA